MSTPTPDGASGTALPMPGSRKAYTSAKIALEAEFRTGRRASKIVRAMRLIVDRHLKEIWRGANMPPGLALIAVGGYGRGELFPNSDVDLLILLPAPPDPPLQQKLESLVGVLWDSGIEVGHSVRTVEECVEAATQDITVQTTLLESRLIHGNRALFRRFIAATVAALQPAHFLEAKLLEQQQRHSRYLQANLEPNLKESPGGLRDLQTILWIASASGNGRNWKDLSASGLITRDEARTLERCEAFMEDLRVRLHYLAGRREDRLLFDHQSALALQLGFADRPHRLASEQLMQRYYRTAKTVSQLNTIVLQNLALRITPPRDRELYSLNDRFGTRDERLETIDPELYERDPGAILETFTLLQDHPELKGIGAATLRALWRARDHINRAFRASPRNRDLFMRIMRSPSRVIRELRRMNQYGVLGCYIPAFGHVVGQMQHDLYHVYTVDEHILKVVRNLRRFAVPELAHEFPLCSRLMSEFARMEVLYLAGLFHDIGKGRGGDHSALGKVDALRFCRAHGLARDDADLVAWLVENHLVMSATAQKQDLTDPDVIRAFTERVGSDRRLTALYLLTVADVRGTSPKVWNAWKGKLLEDLFHATRRLLGGTDVTTTLESSLQARQEEAKAKLLLYALPPEAHERFWKYLDTAYFLRHEAQEIAWHTRLLFYRAVPVQPVVRARLSPAGEGLQVMVYTKDQKELFARICAFFETISYDIIEAKIYTTRHGYALDSFQVQDPDNRQPQYRDLISYIEYELVQRLATGAQLPPPMRPRLSRQLRHFPISPEVSISPDERGTYQVMSIIAGDRPGLLSRIARVLTTYDVNLHNAKINTLGARAEDVFLISGASLADARKIVKLEADLLGELRT